MKDVMKFLQSAGALLYFDHVKSGIADLVFLDPQFLCKIFADIVSPGHRCVVNGVLDRKHIPQIWKRYNCILQEKLLSLLRYFEIAIPLPRSRGGNFSILIPSFLPAKKPFNFSKFWRYDESCHHYLRKWKFEFLPLGFFAKLIVRLMHTPSVHVLCYWRDGENISK